jgi:hypothetical protein
MWGAIEWLYASVWSPVIRWWVDTFTDPERAVATAVGQSFGLSLIVLLPIFAGNIFGLRDLSEGFSRSVFQIVSSPHYRDSGQDRVTTVVLDDLSAEYVHGSYPIPLGDHGRVLRRILCEGPAVVFIDVNFRYLRDGTDGIDRLYEALRYRKQDGVCRPLPVEELKKPGVTKVLLGYVHSETSSCSPFARDLDPRCEDAIALSRLAQVATPVDASDTTGAGTYKLLSAKPGEPPRRSPALQIFDAYCAFDAETRSWCRAIGLPAAVEVVVRWGFYISETTRRYFKTDSCGGRLGRPESFTERMADGRKLLLSYIFSAIDTRDPEAVRLQRCTYATELPAQLLLIAPNDDPRIAAALAGRAVIYGIHITGIPDEIRSPVHGTLPGLHVHAMVVDNLLTLGSRIERMPPEIVWTMTWLQLLEAAIVLVARSVKDALRYIEARDCARGRLIPERRQVLQQWRWIWRALFLGTIFGYLMLNAALLHWPMLNLAAIAGLLWLSDSTHSHDHRCGHRSLPRSAG